MRGREHWQIPMFRIFNSTAAEGLDDLDFVGWTQGPAHVENLLAVHEEPHMRAHAILLVDHTEAHAGIATVEVGEKLAYCGAVRLDRTSARVGAKRCRDEDLHASTITAPRLQPRRFPAGRAHAVSHSSLRRALPSP